MPGCNANSSFAVSGVISTSFAPFSATLATTFIDPLAGAVIDWLRAIDGRELSDFNDPTPSRATRNDANRALDVGVVARTPRVGRITNRLVFAFFAAMVSRPFEKEMGDQQCGG